MKMYRVITNRCKGRGGNENVGMLVGKVEEKEEEEEEEEREETIGR